MKTLLYDVRYSIRVALGAGTFSLLAVLTLALGIGGTTAVYSFVSGILLTPLPYPHPDRLMSISRSLKSQNLERLMVPSNQVTAFREQSHLFAQVSGLEYRIVNLSGAEGPERALAARVLPDLLPLLGIEPALGRAFLAEDFSRRNAAGVILSDRIWQRRFGGRTDVIGTPLRIDGENAIIVGALPPGMELPLRSVDVLTPMSAQELERAPLRFLRAFARLEAGVTRETAQQEVDAIVRRFEEENPSPVPGWGVDVVPLRREIVGNVEPTLLVLLGAVALVLLIACANVASLLLARGAMREKELAIRAALGAGRWRLMRQHLAESLVLSLGGGTFGIVLALAGNDLLVVLSPSNVPRLDEVQVDLRVLGFALAISVATGVVAGILPALLSSRPDLGRSLGATSHTTMPGASRHRLLGMLTVSEVAVALSLLIAAGLMLKSLIRLLAVDSGFKPERVLTMQVFLPEYRYSERARQTAAIEEILERLRGLPEVEAVAASSWTPITGSWARAQVSIEETTGSVRERERWAQVMGVTPGYFRVLGIPFYEGRDFGTEDRLHTPSVAIVNRSFAERAWSRGEAIGKRLKYGGPTSDYPWLTVVGVVGDARLVDLATPAHEGIFVPYLQGDRSLLTLQMVLRTSSPPLRVVNSVRDRIRQVDEELPIDEIRTMEQLVSGNVSRPRFTFLVIGLFALVALSLAAAGIWGVVSYTTTQRNREIGLRLALGADRGHLLKLIVGHGMALVTLGVVAGLAIAFAGTRLLATFLFEVGATDVTTFLSASLLLCGIGLLATFFPAWRASRTDPMITLRVE